MRPLLGILGIGTPTPEGRLEKADGTCSTPACLEEGRKGRGNQVGTPLHNHLWGSVKDRQLKGLAGEAEMAERKAPGWRGSQIRGAILGRMPVPCAKAAFAGQAVSHLQSTKGRAQQRAGPVPAAGRAGARAGCSSVLHPALAPGLPAPLQPPAGLPP